MKDRRGFTLIEITIVAVIVGILVMIAVPNFKEWLDHLRFTGFVREVYSQFQTARNNSLTSGVGHEVVLDNTAKSVAIRRTTDGSAVGNTVAAPWNCDIVSGSNVTFNANGTATSTGNVRILNTSRPATDNVLITVTLGTGRISLQ